MTSLNQVYDNTVRRDTRSMLRKEAIQRGDSHPIFAEPKQKNNQKQK